jgi:hypothetical protein
MILERRAVVLLHSSCTLMTFAFAASCVEVARADVPMLSRHASFDGDVAVHTWPAGTQVDVGPVRRTEDVAGGRSYASQRGSAAVAGWTSDALFADGFQPPH